VGGPKVRGEADGEKEVVAENVQRVNTWRTRRGVRVDAYCVGRTSPGDTLTSVRYGSRGGTSGVNASQHSS
jgi:hypothetical protein